ncbi:MAG: DUF4145 domain-containing protein [Phycisphaerales bacterium JB047]
MTVNRSLYSREIEESSVPPWTCGTCGLGTLRYVSKSYAYKEGTSKLYHGEDYFEPEFVRGRFQVFASCTNDRCEDIVTVSGAYQLQMDVELDHLGVPRQTYVREHFVDHVAPAPRMFAFSHDLPDSVVENLERAFLLFWTDPASALNAARTSIERALDELGVRKYKLVTDRSVSNSGKRKRVFICLHERIGLLPKKYSAAKSALLASKWIGNSGAHGSDLDDEHVLDCFDIAEHGLNLLFDKGSERVVSLIDRVNKKRGPVKSSKKR